MKTFCYLVVLLGILLTGVSTGTVEILTHQLKMTQLALEEKIRSDGDSGIKQIRVLYTGDRPYYSGHHSGYAIAAIHEHVDNIRTMGSGEFVVVLNGVEFRTRHNDFMLRKPHSTSNIYHDTELIEFPDVPPQKCSSSQRWKTKSRK